jgi:hypothetical protein
VFPDAHNFKELLRDHSDVDMEFVQDKWTKYGKHFLQVCISYKLAPQPSTQVISFFCPKHITEIYTSSAIQKASHTFFDSVGMHKRFDYQEAAASESKPPRTFKFAKSDRMKG